MIDRVSTWQPWRAAMAEALYGERGFYRAAGAPGRHFRTAAHASRLWAQSLAELCRRVDAVLGHPPEFTIVDVGAGGGELLTGLAAGADPRWQLVGVDVAPRPRGERDGTGGLPDRVRWQDQLPERFAGVLFGIEWLDVVPVDVVERGDDGLHLVEVLPDGTERLGGPVPGDDVTWLRSWWPVEDVGDRAEVGRPRDEAWAEAVTHVDRGVAVAVDYTAVPGRDVAGTLTGYRDGRQVAPLPDGTCDLTAHVLLESCAAAADADATAVLTQREALTQLGVSGRRPGYGGDPAAYLRELSAVGEAAELLDPGGLGAFGWLVQAKAVPLPL